MNSADRSTPSISILRYVWAWSCAATLFVAGPTLAQQPTSTASETPINSTEPELIKGPPELIAPLPKNAPEIAGDGEAMPVDWPMVLELARASSVEVQISREKLHEANVMVQLAKLQWSRR